jgi:hypothetical protein
MELYQCRGCHRSNTPLTDYCDPQGGVLVGFYCAPCAINILKFELLRADERMSSPDGADRLAALTEARTKAQSLMDGVCS